MTTNPYSPPESTNALATKVRGAVRIVGGPLLVTLVGLVAGYAISFAYVGQNAGARIFLVPAGCMFFASAACVMLIRGTPLTFGLQTTLVLLCSVACWLLFFPVCLASGLLAVGVGFSYQYGPDDTGLLLACLFASSTALNLVFWLLLVILRRRRPSEKTE